jgi:hypothetical protein
VSVYPALRICEPVRADVTVVYVTNFVDFIIFIVRFHLKCLLYCHIKSVEVMKEKKTLSAGVSPPPFLIILEEEKERVGDTHLIRKVGDPLPHPVPGDVAIHR